MALISVIIPCYNAELHIKECLDSVLLQSHEEIEVICINDGSTDGTEVILSEYSQKDERVVVVTTCNQGAPSARNRGVSLSKGEFVQFLDADDVLVKNKLETQLAAFDDETDVVVSDWERRDDLLSEILAINRFSEIEDSLMFVCITKVIITGNPLYKKDAVLKVGGYLEELKAAQDWDFHIRLALEKCKFKYVPGILFVSRQVGGSLSSNWLNVCFQACRVIEKLKPRLAHHEGVDERCRNYLSVLYYNAAVFSTTQDTSKKYTAELLFWAGSEQKFIENKIKRALASICGTRRFIMLERLIINRKLRR